jgi:hypothetical protein
MVLSILTPHSNLLPWGEGKGYMYLLQNYSNKFMNKCRLTCYFCVNADTLYKLLG